MVSLYRIWAVAYFAMITSMELTVIPNAIRLRQQPQKFDNSPDFV